MTKTILYVDHTSAMGGGEIALLNLVQAMDRSRFTPVVAAAAEGPLVDRLRESGIETHVLPLDTDVLDARKDRLSASISVRGISNCLRYTARLAKFMRERQVDLVHTNSLKSDIYGGIAARFAGVPVIWHVRDHIDRHYLPWFVASCFRILSRVIPNGVIAISDSVFRTLNGEGFSHSDCGYNRVAGRSRCIGVHVVHDGCDLRCFPEVEVSATDSDRSVAELINPVVVLVGRIAPWKGQHVFLRAVTDIVEKFPQARFQIVGAPLFGEDAYDRSLHDLAAELEIADRVDFLGFRDDVPDIMRRADVLVHASTIAEPFGQVVIEGMAAGTPVVATNGGAPAEIIQSGQTGILVPMGDSGAMAAAVCELLSNPDRARSIGEAGRQSVRDRFAIDRTAERVAAVYERIFGLPCAGSRQSSRFLAISAAER